jgi:hypothetical protein
MKPANRLTAYLASSLLALASLASAQIEVGGASLNGTVTDQSGQVIAGAKVHIVSPDTGFTRDTTTSAAGLYSFTQIPVGNYSLTVDQSGFRGIRRDNIRLQIGAVATLDFALEVGQLADSITVTEEVPLVETTRSSSATTVNERAVADLPINGRNFIDFTTLTPGVVRDASRGGDLSFAGQRGTANSLLVDGADSNNVFFGQATGRTGFRPYAFSQDAVQEFQVNSNLYPAEIGRAGGGSINVITKSGTNALHGSAFEFFRDKGLNANTWENNKAGRVKSPYHYNQFGGSLGGRVIKDKLFFFGNYDGQRNKSTQVIAPNIPVPASLMPTLGKYLAPYPLQLNNDVYLAKVDWNIGNNDRLSIRYNASRYNGVNFESAGPTSAAEHTGDNRVTTDNIAGNYTHIFSGSILYDARYNWLRDNEPGFATATGPEIVITNGITFGKNNFSPRYTNIKGNQTIHTLSWTAGSHTLKTGVDLNFERVGNYFPGLFAGQYTFASYDAFAAGTPLQFVQAFAGTGNDAPISHPDVNEVALFLQDTWRVNRRLTLNLGGRYDYFGYRQPTTKNTDPGLIALGLRTNAIPTETTNFSPRVGFALKVLNSDQIVVRGGYGVFYQRTPGLMLSTAILQNGIDIRNFTLTPGPGSPIPTYPNVLPSAPTTGLQGLNIYAFDPNFHSARTQQYNVQLEESLGKDFVMTVGYLGVHGNHLARSRDINLYPSVATTGTIGVGGPAVTFMRHPGATAPSRPYGAFARITLFESAADSRYNGMFMQISKRFSHNFQFLSSWTVSRVTDDAPDATAVVPGSDDSKIAQDTLLPNLEMGPGIADIKQRFVISGVYDVNFAHGVSNPVGKFLLSGWQLSTIAQAQTGRRFSATVSGDPNNDGNSSSDRAPGAARDAIVGPGLLQWDLRVSRDINFYGEKLKLRLLGEVFNLLNRANFNTINTTQYTYSNATRVFTPNPLFLTPLTTFDGTTGAFPPRILQLSAKIIF